MANNFFLSQDPLLYQGPFTKFGENDNEMRQKLNDSMMQYRMLQQQSQDSQKDYCMSQRDFVGELDKLLKSSNDEVKRKLEGNGEFKRLNNEFNDLVQIEIMNCIRYKINANPKAVKNMERQTEIISDISKEVEDEQKRSLNDINDYMKNYSNLTFDEYRRMKSGELKVSKETANGRPKVNDMEKQPDSSNNNGTNNNKRR